ncbi:MAG: caspase family protein [Elusimicrobia bacterium]|nr:caspase family protein [Elusimicrobiota bacterium]
MTAALIAAALLLARTAGPSLALPVSPADAKPENTWVFIVSVLEWRASSSYPSFTKQGRRDEALARHFLDDRKVPKDHVVRLKDREATLKRMKSRFAGLIGRAKKGDILFFYYGGHGVRLEPGVTYFIPYDAGSRTESTAWAVPDIIKAIEAGFQGDAAFLAADSCHSGGLCSAARERGRRVSYACLASAQSSSYSTGEWTFTDSLLAGLTGSSRPDSNGDGRVAFSELAGTIESEMAFVEEQMSASEATGGFGPETTVAIVSRAETAPARVQVRWEDGGPGREHPEGSKACASWDDGWYLVTVKGFRLGLYRVHYDGWTDYWDEWLPPSRLRSPGTGKKEQDCGRAPQPPVSQGPRIGRRP